MSRNPEEPVPTKAELDQLVSDLRWLLKESDPDRPPEPPRKTPPGQAIVLTSAPTGIPEIPDQPPTTLLPSLNPPQEPARQRPIFDRSTQLFALMAKFVPRHLLFDVAEPDFEILRPKIEKVLGWAQDPRGRRPSREEPPEPTSSEAEPTLHLELDPDTLDIEFGDSEIAVRRVRFGGTVGWSLMRVICELDAGRTYPIDEVARRIDRIYAALGAEPERSAEGDVVNTDDLASAMAIRKLRRPRYVRPYEGSDDAVKRLDNLLRNTTGRDDAARWRKRWISWNHEARTFRLLENPCRAR